jgi:hypothetical protein
MSYMDDGVLGLNPADVEGTVSGGQETGAAATSMDPPAAGDEPLNPLDCNPLGHWQITCPAMTCDGGFVTRPTYVNIYEGDLHPGGGLLVTSGGRNRYRSWNPSLCRLLVEDLDVCAASPLDFIALTLEQIRCDDDGSNSCVDVCSVQRLDTPDSPCSGDYGCSDETQYRCTIDLESTTCKWQAAAASPGGCSGPQIAPGSGCY